MTNEQRTLCLDHIKNTMLELDVRHAGESAKMLLRHNAERREKESEMMRFSDGIDAQPALFVVPVAPVDDRPFPNEQRFFKGGRLSIMKNGKARPKRMRSDGQVEYFYPAAGKVTMKTEVGTPDFESGSFSGRWFTYQERQSTQGNIK
jgi:hypothetical protein